jgi:hypothetical protein
MAKKAKARSATKSLKVKDLTAGPCNRKNL